MALKKETKAEAETTSPDVISENETKADDTAETAEDVSEENEPAEKESKKTDSIPNHKYNYLDKKIDILGRVMVDSFNKIIFRMNSFKKINNYNKLSVNKYKLSKALKKSNSFYQDISLSITPKLNPNFKSLNEENQ